jgi:hypothetical protein
MALLSKNTGNSNSDFEPCPEGDFQAVVCDVVDLGWIEKVFEGKSQGMKPMIQIVYQVVGTDENDQPVVRDDGKPFLVFGRRLVLSTHERSGFYKELCGILGKSVVDAALETGTLDTEELIGRNVNIVVTHSKSQDGTKTYANIETMKPWNPKYGAPLPPRDYVRRSDRDDWAEKAPAVSAFEEPAIAQRLLAEAAGQLGMLQEQSAAAPTQQQPRATSPREVDPRSVNQPADTRKEYAKQLAKGGELPVKPLPVVETEEDDDDGADIFDQPEGTTAQEMMDTQPALMETVPVKGKRGAAYASGN